MDQLELLKLYEEEMSAQVRSYSELHQMAEILLSANNFSPCGHNMPDKIFASWEVGVGEVTFDELGFCKESGVHDLTIVDFDPEIAQRHISFHRGSDRSIILEPQDPKFVKMLAVIFASIVTCQRTWLVRWAAYSRLREQILDTSVPEHTPSPEGSEAIIEDKMNTIWRDYGFMKDGYWQWARKQKILAEAIVQLYRDGCYPNANPWKLAGLVTSHFHCNGEMILQESVHKEIQRIGLDSDLELQVPEEVIELFHHILNC